MMVVDAMKMMALIRKFVTECGDQFLPMMCMALEEWCLVNDEDVVQTANDLAEIVGQVNEEMGRYA